jgi:hypothetical protein
MSKLSFQQPQFIFKVQRFSLSVPCSQTLQTEANFSLESLFRDQIDAFIGLAYI